MSDGYLHPAYAASFEEVACPLAMPASGGWALSRAITGTALRDGTGCYPVFCCSDWRGLGSDLEALAASHVSFTLVSDPFGLFEPEDLRRAFDLVRPYKRHYVTDMSAPPREPPRRLRRNLAVAEREVTISQVADPGSMSARWTELYRALSHRHRLTGLHAFSSHALRKQLDVPGLRMFAATARGSVVGLHLWFVQGEVAYAHLGAIDALGHELSAGFALYSHALDALRSEARWAALGGAPGEEESETTDGLSSFKRLWATSTRQTYLCGRVLQPDAYETLARGFAARSNYFPSYRSGEWAMRPDPRDAPRGGPR